MPLAVITCRGIASSGRPSSAGLSTQPRPCSTPRGSSIRACWFHEEFHEMTFEEARRHLQGIPHLGDAQAWELYQFIQRERPRSCLELGHAHGTSSSYIAAALDSNGGHLDTVD